MDALSRTYEPLLAGRYDCLDRIVVNAYFRTGHDAGGFRVWWWRKLTGSEDTLDNAHLIRMAGRFGRRLRAWAAENKTPVRGCWAGEAKHEIGEEFLHYSFHILDRDWGHIAIKIALTRRPHRSS